MPKLVIIVGENSGTVYSLEQGSIIVGRSPDVNVTIHDPRASRKHASLTRIEDEFYLEDLQSQNGTFLNGQQIKQRCLLKDQDNIRIGNTVFSFCMKEKKEEEENHLCGYQILQNILEETTGKIYIAEQKSLQRNVILWVLEVFGTSQEQSSTHNIFVENISKIAQLFHPNIMMLLDFAVSEKYYLCAFEELNLRSNVQSYVQSELNLAENLGETKDSSKKIGQLHTPNYIPVEKVLHFALQTASALECAHSHNIFHLHLTSKNILIQPNNNRIVLTELGVSLFLNATGLLNTANILGTWEYIAPEQISGATQPDHRTDIYSYGCFLYHLLVGSPPFMSETPSTLAKMHLEQKPAPLTEKRSDIPESLLRLVNRCLEKNVDDRFSSFQEITQELARIQKKIQSRKPATTSIRFIPRTIKKWWVIFPLLGIIIGTFIFFAIPLFI